ncbi:hypothetical protein Cs7R123_48050 [Catellatospora sp. TT07R-123]|uniref:hypothetical protein n=1 Tax=Catellatospora sp. TT07R-123 TaxID=2733863 RepID=UPI001B106275|nr:hypothetical protein [Catellatospora sp. TT07R-123]GHJ47463.1 hypothetical protein Cs7R123_48050 [Catellatospora sp. TT07R-123]
MWMYVSFSACTDAVRSLNGLGPAPAPGTGPAVDHTEAFELARKQIAAAAALMAQHRPIAGGHCSCTRQLPCSVAVACAQASERHSQLLPFAHPTVELPQVGVARR